MKGNLLLTKFHNAFSNQKYFLSNVTRFHGRIRFDEYHSSATSKFYQKLFLKQEKDILKKAKEFIEDEFIEYYEPSMNRKDPRTKEYPEFYDDYSYYSKNIMNPQGISYPLICRKKLSSMEEEIVLDLSEVPFIKKKNLSTSKIAKIIFSDDHSKIGFIVDLTNSENYVSGFRNLDNGKYSNEVFENVNAMAFASDPRIVYYVKYDKLNRGSKLYTKTLGIQNEKLLYTEQDESHYLDLTTTKDKKYNILISATKTITEVRINDRNLSEKFDILIPRTEKKRIFINHCDQGFLIMDNSDDNHDLKISLQLAIDTEKIEFYKLPKFNVFKDMDIFEKYIVIYASKDGTDYLEVVDLGNPSNKYNVKVNDSMGLIISPGMNNNYKTNKFTFHVDSPLFYDRIYEHDIFTKHTKLIESPKLLGKPFIEKDYITERIFASTADSEEIPITIVHNRKMKLNRRNKVLLHGYGCYGLACEPHFNVSYLTALEKGWVIAYAHTRGGNEKGNYWHKSATKESKILAIHDFIDCAEKIIYEGISHPSLLCAFGSSAGGLIVGASMNIKPELFKATVLDVPFLDILTILCDEKLPLTKSDYDEFGNPIENEKIYDNIFSYSPYDNIIPEEYPFVYIRCGVQDFRVPFWSILKYVKRFRDTVKSPIKVTELSPKNILIDVNSFGHYGGPSSEDSIRDSCIMFAFLDKVVNSGNMDIIKNREKLKLESNVI